MGAALQRNGYPTSYTPLTWSYVLWAASPMACRFAMVARLSAFQV